MMEKTFLPGCWEHPFSMFNCSCYICSENLKNFYPGYHLREVSIYEKIYIPAFLSTIDIEYFMITEDKNYYGKIDKETYIVKMYYEPEYVKHILSYDKIIKKLLWKGILGVQKDEGVLITDGIPIHIRNIIKEGYEYKDWDMKEFPEYIFEAKRLNKDEGYSLFEAKKIIAIEQIAKFLRWLNK